MAKPSAACTSSCLTIRCSEIVPQAACGFALADHYPPSLTVFCEHEAASGLCTGVMVLENACHVVSSTKFLSSMARAAVDRIFPGRAARPCEKPRRCQG